MGAAISARMGPEMRRPRLRPSPPIGFWRKATASAVSCSAIPTWPNIGHSDDRYATIEDAYARRNGTPAWQGAAEIMIGWLRGLDDG